MSYEVEVSSDLRGPDGRSLGIMNTTAIATGDLEKDPQVQGLVRQLSAWVDNARAGTQRGGMFDRTLFTPPNTPYDNMRTAFTAVAEDDIVGSVAEATEALAFAGGLKWESSNSDDADFFNQLSGDINLDDKIRQMWREEFATDQFVTAKLWDWKEYTVRGNSENGNKRKKKYRVWCPVRLVMLNQMSVVPIGFGPLREDRLAWQATEYEIGTYQQAYADQSATIDPLMTTFFTGTYSPGVDEERQEVQWGVEVTRLLAMSPDNVFRHCHNRPDYAKFSDIRLRSVFPLLDLKRQLMASDRAMLVGSANYILLIRKGSDDKPATQEEVQNLKEGYNFLAKLPVIISDHRLTIDIIAPKLDFVLKEDNYATLNAKILARTLSTFLSTAGSSSSKGPDTFESVLAQVILNRRHMIKRTLEAEIGKAVINHPKNKGVFDASAGVPSLVFTPRNVTIGTNQAYLQMLASLRTQREISRETILDAMGLDESTEAQRLELEEKIYDDIFKTQIPFSAGPAAPPYGLPPEPPEPDQPDSGGPNAGDAPAKKPATKPAAQAPTKAPTKAPAKAPTKAPAKPAAKPVESPAVSGGRGGRPVGGGRTAQNPAKQSKPKTANGNPSTKAADDTQERSDDE